MQISIIVPTYKPQDYLWQCLDSLAAQTIDKGLWELIVVLNGCAEPWLSQIKAYQANHPQLPMRVLQTDEPGVSNARNIGMDAAKGDYIGFIDDDDYVSPTYLEELTKIATPDTVAASYTIGFSDTQAYIPYYLEKEYIRCADRGKQSFYKAKKYFGGPCMKLIHRDMIGEQRFDTRFKNGEDSLFMFAISDKIRNVQFTSTQAIYYRRFRTGSASHTMSWTQNIQNCTRLIGLYTRIYMRGKGYNISFYFTRVLAAIHTIISK